jgi:hypothetical protein
VLLQAIYPVTSCTVLSDNFSQREREAHAAAMRQAIALLRWAHKFGAALHLQRAERCLNKHMQLLVAMRARGAAQDAATLKYGYGSKEHTDTVLEKSRRHQSTENDLLFECWGVADRLSLHAVASACEWALTMLWEEQTVYARAAKELSKHALQRIARSLCEGMSYVRSQEKVECVDEYFMKRFKVASVWTMMEWRESDEAQAASPAKWGA